MSKIKFSQKALGPEVEEPPVSLSELYHENSKFHRSTISKLAKEFSYSAEEARATALAFKQYALFPKIKLPDFNDSVSGESDFDKVISNRRALRDFGKKPLTFEELSKILYQSYGVTGEITLQDGVKQPLRAVPSAGALYPAEIYLGVLNVAGLEQGIYHYNVPRHELEFLVKGNPMEDLYNASLNQEYVKKAAVVVLISGVFSRTKHKYGERGYRYVFLDIGHLGQNLYLSCSALNLAIMTTCGFYDDEINKLLKIDGIDESILYIGFLGKRATD